MSDEGWSDWSISCDKGHPISGETPDTPVDSRSPCAVCGSVARVIAPTLTDKLTARDAIVRPPTMQMKVEIPPPSVKTVEVGQAEETDTAGKVVPVKGTDEIRISLEEDALAIPLGEARDRIARVALVHLAGGRLSLAEIMGTTGPAAYRLVLRGDAGEVLAEIESADIDEIGIELALALRRYYGPDPETGR